MSEENVTKGNEAVQVALAEFTERTEGLKRGGYVPLVPAHVSEIANEVTCESRLGLQSFGGPIRGSFGMFDAQQSKPMSVVGAGTKGFGYIPWGADNKLPNLIFNLTASLPYTAAAMENTINTTVGYGPELMYEFTRYCGGTVVTKQIPYKDAGVMLRGRIRELRQLGDLDELAFALEAYDKWKQTHEEVKRFQEENNLMEHFLKCMTDDAHMDIYFPTIGLSIGRVGEEWKPKVVKIGHLPVVCTRLEEMDERLRINYVYYAEKWRNDATQKLDAKSVVAYPALMPGNMLNELRRRVAAANRTGEVRKTAKWFCCPSYYPSMAKPYYPQPSWWSIFPSRIYDYAATLITDRATARANGTMWGKIIYVNQEYIRNLFDQQGADTPEKKMELLNQLYADVNNFLRRKENNGKTMFSDLITGADGQLHRAIEIVDVPQVNPVSGASDSELTTIVNCVFFALQTHPSMVGASPSSKTGGGTMQRELFLLKQVQRAPRQQIYLRWLNTIHAFNGWDDNAKWVIRMPSLTTLDNNPTGLVAYNTDTVESD